MDRWDEALHKLPRPTDQPQAAAVPREPGEIASLLARTPGLIREGVEGGRTNPVMGLFALAMMTVTLQWALGRVPTEKIVSLLRGVRPSESA